MTITIQPRSMRFVLAENDVSAVGVPAWKGRYGSSTGNLPCGRDGWYGVADGHHGRFTPTLVA